MKKYIITLCALTFSSVILANTTPQTVTVTINSNNVTATPNVTVASVKYVSVFGTPPQEQTMAIRGFKSLYLSRVVHNLKGLGIFSNVYLSAPNPSYTPAPYYVWFGIDIPGMQHTLYPPSCEILLNANKNINAVTIHQNYCTIS